MIAMVRKITITLIFVIGFSIFSYPIISHLVKTKEHYTIISQHNEVLAQMDEDEKAKERDKAKAYNESISESTIPIEDPFSQVAETTASSSYYNALNIGETIGHLQIPSINVNLPIYHGIGADVVQAVDCIMSNFSLCICGVGVQGGFHLSR